MTEHPGVNKLGLIIQQGRGRGISANDAFKFLTSGKVIERWLEVGVIDARRRCLHAMLTREVS
jgi:hypothetical protein